MTDPDDYLSREFEMKNELKDDAKKRHFDYAAQARAMQQRHAQNVASGLLGVGGAAVSAASSFAMVLAAIVAVFMVFK